MANASSTTFAFDQFDAATRTMPTLTAKVQAIKNELNLSPSLVTVRDVLDAANVQVGLPPDGSMMDQVNRLLTTLGLELNAFDPAVAATTKPSAIVGVTQWAHQATNLADIPATPTPSTIADAADVTQVTSLADTLPATLKPSAITDVDGTQATNLVNKPWQPASTGAANAPTAANKATVVAPASTAATNAGLGQPKKLAINALCDPRDDQCDTKLGLVCTAANQRCHHTSNLASHVRSSTRGSGCDAMTFDFTEGTLVVVWVVMAAFCVVSILDHLMRNGEDGEDGSMTDAEHRYMQESEI